MKPWIIFIVLILRFQDVCTGQETTVSCLYNSSCFLSCNYKTGTATIIHWNYMTGGDVIVHSFFYDKDQFDHQDPRYKGRTSLVEDQDTERTTELLLKNVKVQDEGKYKCFADSEEHGYKTSYVVLQVDAPVQRVDMVRAGNSATCSSEGVYPKPELTWSSSPQSSSTVQQTEEKLYNIYSSLKLSDMDGDLLLSCTVSTRLNKWTTTTTWRNPIVTTTSRAQISCSHTNTSFMDFNLLWRFNHTHVIMRWNRTDGQHVSAQWKKHVEAEKVSDVLHLQNLSSDQEGTYSCELSRAEETTATHTLLRVETQKDFKERSHVVVPVVVGVTVVFLIVIIMVPVYRFCCKSDQSFFHWLCPMRGQPPERGRVQNNEQEMKPMMKRDGDGDGDKDGEGDGNGDVEGNRDEDDGDGDGDGDVDGDEDGDKDGEGDVNGDVEGNRDEDDGDGDGDGDGDKDGEGDGNGDVEGNRDEDDGDGDGDGDVDGDEDGDKDGEGDGNGDVEGNRDEDDNGADD
uniref:Ig-like domain-containing protein n=1 Tax=Gouania willdenowi TaxID=441366 RepID=A0A8C5N7V0_GOUWI